MSTTEQSSKTLFNVVFQGKLATGFDQETAIANFARAFKLPPKKAAILFDGQRRVIKKNLSREKASVFRQRLKKLGVRVALVKVEPPEKSSRLSLLPPGSMLASPVYRPPVHIDIRNLSFSEITTPLVEKTEHTPPAFDLSGLAAENDYEKLEPRQTVPAPALDLSGLALDKAGVVIIDTPKPPPAAIDTSALTLDAPGAIVSEPKRSPPPNIDISHLSLAEEPED